MFARILIVLILLCSAGTGRVLAAEHPSVRVSEAYVNLHTGPGRGYPVTQIVERGGYIQILLRKTDWFKVRTKKGFEGWVSLEDMQHTLDLEGEGVKFDTVGRDQYAHRRWETGVKMGDFSGSTLLSTYLGYYFTQNLSAELTLSQALGNFSDSELLNISITHQPWPEWRFSPYLTLGGGVIYTKPDAKFVQTRNRTDQTVHAGLGLRIYVTRRFMVRAEYRSNVILTNINDNFEIDEWTLGFSAFF